MILRTFPSFSPYPSGKNDGNYCKYALINISLGLEKSILHGMDLTVVMKITFNATMHFLPLNVMYITFQCYNKSFNKHGVKMEVNMKRTTVMVTMMEFHNAKKNLRSGCCSVLSMNAMMTQSHKKTNRMKSCSLTGQKLPDQCHLIYCELDHKTKKRRSRAPIRFK